MTIKYGKGKNVKNYEAKVGAGWWVVWLDEVVDERMMMNE